METTIRWLCGYEYRYILSQDCGFLLFCVAENYCCLDVTCDLLRFLVDDHFISWLCLTCLVSAKQVGLSSMSVFFLLVGAKQPVFNNFLSFYG